MEFRFSLKDKEASVEADVERLIEKRLDFKEKNPERKTRYQIKQEEKRKNEELKQKQLIQGVCLLAGVVIFVLVICFVGTLLGA